MEVHRKPQARALRRCYQCWRHDEQLLVLAYEQVHPQARRVLPVGWTNERVARDERPSATRRA